MIKAAARMMIDTAAPMALSVAAPAPLPQAFGPAERRLFGWFHPPAAGRTRDTAVVLCNPIGHEALYTHAAYRCLAERLAEAGYPALRFDYDGTGDSTGSDADPDRVESWLASIGCAGDALREWSGSGRLALFGVRLGATLAALAASQQGRVEALMLWGHCRSGKNFLREMRVLQAASGEPTDPAAAPEYEEAGGFFYTPETVERLMRLDAFAVAAQPARRALLVERDDLPNDQRLGKRLTEIGTEVTQARWPGFAAMMRDPQETAIPEDALDSIVGWLDEQTQPAGVRRFAPQIPRRLPATLAAGPEFTEEPVQYGLATRAFGILTRPRDADTNSDAKTAVVLLNVGANYHIGPGRMYVDLARHLAARGFMALRLDAAGIGDAARGDGAERDHVYSQSAVTDAHDAVTHLQAQYAVERVVVVGLCSGAYTAYKAASSDRRIVGQVLINPQTFEWKEGDSLEVRTRSSYKRTQVYLSGLHDAATLKRILLRQVNVKGIMSALLQRLIARLRMTGRHAFSMAVRLRPFETPILRTFRQIAARGAKTLFIFSSDDVGLDLIAQQLGAPVRKLCGRGSGCGIALEIIGDADHTFTPKAAREAMLSLVADSIADSFPASGADK